MNTYEDTQSKYYKHNKALQLKKKIRKSEGLELNMDILRRRKGVFCVCKRCQLLVNKSLIWSLSLWLDYMCSMYDGGRPYFSGHDTPAFHGRHCGCPPSFSIRRSYKPSVVRGGISVKNKDVCHGTAENMSHLTDNKTEVTETILASHFQSSVWEMTAS